MVIKYKSHLPLFLSAIFIVIGVFTYVFYIPDVFNSILAGACGVGVFMIVAIGYLIYHN